MSAWHAGTVVFACALAPDFILFHPLVQAQLHLLLKSGGPERIFNADILSASMSAQF